MFFGDRLHHEFEERVSIGGHKNIVILPVHLELAICVLMVVLVGLPAKRDHGVADFRHDVIAAHQRLLVVTWLGLLVGRIGNCGAIRRNQEILTFDAGLHLIAGLRRARDDVFEHLARVLLDQLAVHDEIACYPRYPRLPRQRNYSIRVRHDQNIRICRRHVEPGREACKTRTCLGDRCRSH